MDEVTSEFSEGVDAYWSGELPEDWNNAKARERSPYLTGWYMASMWETAPGWLTDKDQTPLQEEEEY